MSPTQVTVYPAVNHAPWERMWLWLLSPAGGHGADESKEPQDKPVKDLTRDEAEA